MMEGGYCYDQQSTDIVDLWLNEGTFELPLNFAAVSHLIAVADFNGDGKPDVSAAGAPRQGNTYVSVLLNTSE